MKKKNNILGKEEDMETSEIKKWLEKLLDSMLIEGASVEVEVDDRDRVLIEVQVAEEDSGVLIGYRGEVLVAIQRLIRIVFGQNMETGEEVKILLNVNNYRTEREEKLRQTARRGAQKALETGRNYLIHGLSAAERYIVHETLAEEEQFADLTSWSEGESYDRVLIIGYK